MAIRNMLQRGQERTEERVLEVVTAACLLVGRIQSRLKDLSCASALGTGSSGYRLLGLQFSAEKESQDGNW